MRKLFVAVLAIAGLVACTKDVTVDVPEMAPIEFSDSFVEIKTRAANEAVDATTINTANIDAFDVWGYMNSFNGKVFVQERVTKDAGKWTYNNLQYWLPDNSYFFHALAPVDSQNIVVKELSTNVSAGLGTVEFTNTGVEDLLYAQHNVSTPATISDNPDPIKFQFAHLLSKVKLTFKNGFDNELATLKITDVKITNAPKVGTIDLTAERADRVWKLDTNNITEIGFGDVNGGAAIPTLGDGTVDNAAESDYIRYIFPWKGDYETLEVSFNVQLYMGEEVGYEAVRTATIKNQEFKMGKAYNLTAEINADNLDLLPIEFDEITVEEWDVWGDVDFSDKVNDEGTTPSTPSEPVKEARTVTVTATNDVEKMYVYAWYEGVSKASTTESTTTTEITAAWPGDEMTKDAEKNVFTYTFAAEYDGQAIKMIFNNGQGGENNQTADLELTLGADAVLDYTVDILPVEPETPETPVEPTENKLYLNTGSDWYNDNGGNVWFAAYFFGNGETWTKMTAVEGETYLFETTIPEGYTSVIFVMMYGDKTALDWGSRKNQTVDITLPTDGSNLYTIENPWDGDKEWKAWGSWSVYTPATTEPETPEDPEEPEVVYTTVADFLAAAVDGTTFYTLKGTITRVASTSYGNFDLTDETGTIYVYGLYSKDGATNKYWATSGAQLGDDIVISAVRADYNGSAQAGSARFMGLTSPGTIPFYAVDLSVVDFASAGGEQVVVVSAYNTDAAVTATSDNTTFTVAVDGYNVTITAPANELEQDVTGNVTIKVGDLDETVVKVTLAGKPAAGVVEGGKDDFDTLTANTSYTTGTTKAGWAYTNCAILASGTVSAIIDDSKGLTINGKTTAKGSITSPVISTGCGTLKFNYAYGYNESNGISLHVAVMQNGAAVAEWDVVDKEATQNTAYTFDENVSVAGDFQIVITNNSPTNSTKSNKDRYTIWDVEWTGYNN